MLVADNQQTFTVVVVLTEKSVPEAQGARCTFVAVILRHGEHCDKNCRTIERV